MFDFLKPTPSISVEELATKLNPKIQLFDVRSKQEYQAGHIPQAKNMPLERINNLKADKNKEVFVICQSGARSKMAVQKLKKMGYQAYNIRGGMMQWKGSTIRGGK